jgi:membrane protease YdiL (CAAX protease family)
MTTQAKEVFLPRRGNSVTTSQSSQVVQSTVTKTWRWMWPDILMRILPMGLIPFLYIVVLRLPLSFLGLDTGNIPQQLFLGLLVGSFMCIFAIAYRLFIVGRWFRRPTPDDQLVQSLFYLCINGPVEELFFRGFLLAIVTQWTGWPGWGWLVSTAAYTLYHRLGKWNWRSVGGVGLAGIVFSLVYLLQPGPRSLLAVIIVHGLTTCGFLSWGDEALYHIWKRRQAQIK